ncbi:MAG TPA: GTPase [Trebonia sp.]|nr:GTPase [Trebonia sp.]
MSMLPSVGPQQMGERNLSPRLDALAELVRIGRPRQGQGTQAQPEVRALGQDDGGGFSKVLLDDAEAVLKRAGERLRLSGNHTVVALAGGTGSGKSTLFNALSGATFSPPGVTRPMTRHVHACVWGMQGAAPLLDWLGVQRRHRYARASVLDSGESDLDGLILLDLPDHDSVVTASMAAVDRLSKLADMVIWVLDPQKYADAAVHNRYLIPLAGHATVFTVVLNQIDVLSQQQARDCEEDLRRLLDHEGLIDAPVFPVSARTGAGLGELRLLLTETVTRNRVVTDRIAADIDAMIGGFAVYGGPQVAPDAALAVAAGAPLLSAPLPDQQPKVPSKPPWDLTEEEQADALQAPASSRPPWEDATPDDIKKDGPDPGANVPQEAAARLTDAFARAAGLSAVAQALASSREAQAARLTGWPAGRLLSGRRDPMRALRAAGGAAAAAPGQAQQSEVDNAITAFADAVGGGLPEPWAGSLREAARSNAGMVPRALSGAVRAVVAEGKSGPPGWWRLVTAWQWLLTVLAAAGVVLSVVIAVARLTGHRQGWISEVSLIPLLLVMAVAMLVLGYVTAVSCRNAAVAAADQERQGAEGAMHSRVAGVTHDLVLVAAGREIAQYERFRRELAVAAAGRLSPAPRQPAVPSPAAVQGETERVQVSPAPVRDSSLGPWVVETGRPVGIDDRHGGVDVAVALVVGRGPGPYDAQRVDVQVLELLHDRGLVQVACLLDRPVDLKPGVPAFLAVLDRVIVAEARGLHAGDVLGQAGRGGLVRRGAARLGLGQPVLH